MWILRTNRQDKGGMSRGEQSHGEQTLFSEKILLFVLTVTLIFTFVKFVYTKTSIGLYTLTS